jgi:hypothetical protein
MTHGVEVDMRLGMAAAESSFTIHQSGQQATCFAGHICSFTALALVPGLLWF